MNLFAWALFGVINGLILNLLDKNPKKEQSAGAMMLGMLGAVSGGTVAYLLFGGMKSTFDLTLLLIVLFEAILVYMLTAKKPLYKLH